MKPKLTPTIVRGLNHLAAIASLEDGPHVDDREGRKDHAAAFDALGWIRAVTPKRCGICSRPMFGRSVLNRDNKLVHPRCAP